MFELLLLAQGNDYEKYLREHGYPITQPVQPGITNPVLPSALQRLSGIQYLQKMLPNLIGLLFVIGAIIFLFIMLIGGIQWIASGGDKAALESARGKITSAIIGMVILIATFAIIKLIETVFGISILTLDIGPLIIQ